jgi:hypothetical protein
MSLEISNPTPPVFDFDELVLFNTLKSGTDSFGH